MDFYDVKKLSVPRLKALEFALMGTRHFFPHHPDKSAGFDLFYKREVPTYGFDFDESDELVRVQDGTTMQSQRVMVYGPKHVAVFPKGIAHLSQGQYVELLRSIRSTPELDGLDKKILQNYRALRREVKMKRK